MSSSKEKKEKIGNEEQNVWRQYMARCVEIYLLYVILVFVLYCKNGFIDYDINKRNTFYFGSIGFIFASLVVVGLEKINQGTQAVRKKLAGVDLWTIGILVVWTLGLVFSINRSEAFWGDQFRYTGFLFTALALVGMYIVSKYFELDVWLTRGFVLSCICIYALQYMNLCGVDPLGWTNYGEFTWLMSSLGNLDQNACFDALTMAVLMGLYLLCKDVKSQIIYAVVLFMGMVGGIATNSDNFYLGLVATVLVMIAFALQKKEYLMRLWQIAIAFYLGMLVQYMNFHHGAAIERAMGTGGSILLSGKMLLVLLIMLIVLGIVIWKFGELLEAHSAIIKKSYVGIVLLALIGCVICFVLANVTSLGAGVLSPLKFTDEWGNARGLIWRVTLGTVGQESLIHKLVGVGFNNFNNSTYQYYAQDLVAVWGVDTILADAHNMYLDYLLATGIVGTICYWGMFIHCLVKSIQAVKKNPIAMIGVVTIITYFAIGLINANLIVVMPIMMMLLGIFWNMNARILAEEDVDTHVELMK